ncbi:DHA1 family bicyclomycin/chloramphenicol resistance-like MFS transporter [Azospirillum fermentarium]|uniref:MFS transporter n=1 Tax=Azospirillum fermentarium TaxID=1233114 RepID=UPI00222709C1|nr:MFS transporter [Azospirillum fermentarium]MCW2244633.1 DHA1 family bicyclomycin/chloramphenicol resistance-like MFS transporter [Azospirillum fermentarium]
MPNRSPANPTLLLAALAGLGEFAATAYLPAIPSMAATFETGPGAVQATVSAGLLTFAAANLVLGPLSDRVGRRAVLLPALAVYLIGCALAVAAPAVAWLYPARVLTAAGACAGLAVGRAVARDLYDGADLTRRLTAVTLAFSVAPVLAPLIGGALTEVLGWRSVFLAAFLYAAVLVPCVWRFPETLKVRQTQQSLLASVSDYPAMALRRESAPALFASALLVAALFCFLVGAPVIFLTSLGLSPAVYGCFPLIAMSGFVLGALLSARLAGRLPGWRAVRAGTAIAFSGTLVMLAVPVSPVGMLGAMALFNTGLGLALPAAGADVLRAFPGRAGQASALLGFIQIAGGALGAGMASSGAGAPERMVPVTMAVLAGLACVTATVPGPVKARETAP